MPTYTFVCKNCTHVTDAFFSLSEERPSTIQCEACYGIDSAEYTLAAPMVTRASYLDGTDRFRDFKEAAKLEKESSSLRSKESKREIAREIRKLGVTLKKDNPI